MELFELTRALKYAQRDPRIKGLFADFSGLHVPSSVTPEPLGMAQLEELLQAVHDFKQGKEEQNSAIAEVKKALIESEGDGKVAMKRSQILSEVEVPKQEGKESMEEKSAGNANVAREAGGPAKGEGKDQPVESEATLMPTTIAWADSFDSQGAYLLASAFDHVYLQPSGEVPLTGVAAQLPFVKRALDWLGVKVYAEARREYKSMVKIPAQPNTSLILSGNY